MTNENSANIIRLSDTNLTLEHAAEDVRDFKVIDATGADIGHVDDLMVDDTEKKVRFLVVGAGGFLGIGEKRFLVPVDAVAAVETENQVVRVDRHVDHLKESPVYDPEIVPAEPYLNDVYSYYGIAPFWGAGYIYPPYPYIMGNPGNMV